VFEGSFKTLDFGGAIMKNVQFRGSLYDVTFHGWKHLKVPHPRQTRSGDKLVWQETPYDMVPNKMEGVDFSKSELRMTNLTDYCYLDRAIFPPLSTHCVFRRTARMVHALKDDITKALPKKELYDTRDKLIKYVAARYEPHPTQPHEICCAEDLSASLGAEDGRKLYEIVVESSQRIGTHVTGLKAT
jgi:hypothetical protein